jgi:benzaldehyde dehydrogenase (NAD)
MTWVSVNSCSPCRPSSRPMPLALNPPKGSMERGLEIAERLNTGIVHVNDQTLNNDAYAPFGGTGASGNGSRFGSQSSWDEFTQWQWVTARPQADGFPF